MHYLIDGYNLLRAVRKLSDSVPPGVLELERNWLLKHLHELLKDNPGANHEITIVYDAKRGIAGPKKASKYPEIAVVFTTGSDADSYIEAVLLEERFPKALVVVSDDKRLIKAAEKKGCLRIGCLDLEFHLRDNSKPKEELHIPMKPIELTPDETAQWEELFFPEGKGKEEFEGLSDPFFRPKIKKPKKN